MRKEKLIARRIARNLSQNEVAQRMAMEQSTYSRRESGGTKIATREWEKRADILDCEVADIYEPEMGQMKFDNKNATFQDNSGNNNHYYNIPMSVLENLQDFITFLKEENSALTKELKSYKR